MEWQRQSEMHALRTRYGHTTSGAQQKETVLADESNQRPEKLSE